MSIILIVFWMLFGVSLLVGHYLGPWIGLIFLILSFGGFILQGLHQVPAQPPHKAVITRFGERQTRQTKKDEEKDGGEVIEETLYKNEGWRFFPLRPYWYGYIDVDVSRKELVFNQFVKTPDRADSEVPVIIVFRPISKYLNEYINSGQADGVRQFLEGRIKERLREWAMSSEEGPMDWRELNRSQLEAVSVLLKSIIGKEIKPKIPDYAQGVPTFIWMRYFTQPRPSEDKVTKNERHWAKDAWKKVTEIYDELDESQKQELKKIVEERKDEVVKLRQGEGRLEIFNLGISIEQINIKDIKLHGETATVADREAKEVEEKEAEVTELKHVENSIKKFMDLGFTKEQALEIVQTERDKVKKVINESKLNLDTSEGVRAIFSSIAQRF